MADNRVSFSDLFDFSNDQEVQKAINLIANLDKTYDKLLSDLSKKRTQYAGETKQIVEATKALQKQIASLNPTLEKDQQALLAASRSSEMLSSGYSNLTTRIKGLEESNKKLAKEKEAVNSKTKEALRLQKEEEKLKAKLDALTTKEAQSVAKLREQITRKNAEMKKAIASSLDAAKIYDSEVRKLDQLRNNYKNVAAQMGVNSKQARQLRTELTALDTRIKTIDASAGQFQRNVGNYRSALAGLAGGFRQVASALGFTGLIFAVVAAFRGAFNIFKEFQRENAVLAGVLGKTRDEIGALTKDATRLGAVTARTATEVTKLQIEYARLGFTEREILNLTESTIQGSVALNAELSRMAALVGAVVRTFDDLDSTDAGQIVDQLTLASNKSALSFSKLETSLPIVSGAANAVGLELAEVLAVLGKLSDAGIDASTSATAFRNILIESAGRGKNYKELLDQVRNSTNQLTTAYDLFGKRGAVQAVILANNTQALEDLNKELGEEFAGKAGKAAAVQLDNVAGSATLAKSAIEGFVLSIENGNGKLSVFAKAFIDTFTEAVGVLTAFNNGTINAIEAVGAFTSKQAFAAVQTKIKLKALIAEREEQEKLSHIQIESEKLYKQALGAGIKNYEEFTKRVELAGETEENRIAILSAIQKKYTDDLINQAATLSDDKDKSIEQQKEELKLLKERFRTVKDVDERERLRAEIIELEGKIKALDDLKNKYKDNYKETEKLARGTEKVDEEIEIVIDTTGKWDKKLEGIDDQYQKIVDGKYVDKVEQDTQKAIKATLTWEQRVSKLGEVFSEWWQRFGFIIDKAFEAATATVNQFFTNAQIRRDNELTAFEDKQQTEIDLLEARRERELEGERLTAEQKASINQRYATQIGAIEDKIEAKRRKAQLDQAKANKRSALFNSIIQTARWVVELGIVTPQAIAAGALGTLLTGLIASEPLPAFFKGTDNAPAGPKIVSEKGPELVQTPGGKSFVTGNKGPEVRTDIPAGSKIIPADLTKKILEGYQVAETPAIYSRAAENMQKVARQEKLNNESLQKSLNLVMGSQLDKLGDRIEKAQKSVTLETWGMTEKGQITKGVRKGNTIWRNVDLERKY